MVQERKQPAYQQHRATGQAKVRLDGKDHYLGRYGSPESLERYESLLAVWLMKHGDSRKFTLSIAELVLMFLEHAKLHYRKDGEPTSELKCIKLALRHLVKLHRATRVHDFGPRAFKEVRDSMIAAGYVRNSINSHMGRVRRVFAWAVAEELAPPTLLVALQAVQGLQADRSRAKESIPVRAVSHKCVEAVRPHVSKPVWGAIQVQLLTGMRSGEVLAMRGCDLNIAGAIWEYTPATHKTQHHGHRRAIFIGPKAQDVLRAFLRTNLAEYLFQPAEGRAAWLSNCDGPGRRARTTTKDRQASARYSTVSFMVAIRRACERAFEMPHHLRKVDKTLSPAEQQCLKAEASAWRRQNCWHPHQLRHAAATLIRREAGIESARVVLGHSSAVTSELYAEVDDAKSREIMLKLG